MKEDFADPEEMLVEQAQGPARRVANGDISLAYWVYGQGSPLLMLTGLSMPATTWGPLPSLLGRRGYKAVVMDNRDSGSSTVCEGVEYDIADMAVDALKVLDDTGIEKTDLVGLSMGGFIAQELALTYPERVNRLMLISTGPGIGGGLPPETELMDALLNAPAGEDPREATARLVAMLTGPGWAEENPRIASYAVNKRLGIATDVEAVGRHWVASAMFSSWDRLAGLKCPVKLIHGDKDPLIPIGNGQNLASRIAGAQLVTLPGAGHLTPLERPRELLKEIESFFPFG